MASQAGALSTTQKAISASDDAEVRYLEARAGDVTKHFTSALGKGCAIGWLHSLTSYRSMFLWSLQTILALGSLKPCCKLRI